MSVGVSVGNSNLPEGQALSGPPYGSGLAHQLIRW